MPKMDRVDTASLRSAGLKLMRENGKLLERKAGRAEVYTMPNGDCVRVRTSNDRNLVARAKRPAMDAPLDIEGTDWLLIVMPEIKRTAGRITAYLVPAEEAAETVRRCHEVWLRSIPDTKGENTTPTIWFDSSPSSATESGGYAEKWARYRLEGSAFAT